MCGFAVAQKKELHRVTGWLLPTLEVLHSSCCVYSLLSKLQLDQCLHSKTHTEDVTADRTAENRHETAATHKSLYETLRVFSVTAQVILTSC